MQIRHANKEDASQLLTYIKALAADEEFPFPVTVTLDDVTDNLLSSNTPSEAVMLHEDGNPIGFAVYYFTFSTTTGKKGLHLDDLYIEPKFHGKGYGKQAMTYLAKIAQEHQCARFEWWALKTNVNAIKFYQNLGAKQLDELAVFRLDGDKLDKLCKSESTF